MEEEFLKHPGIADGKVSDLDLLAAVCDAEAGDRCFPAMSLPQRGSAECDREL